MNRSEQVNELAAALAKAQAKMKGATKDNTNPHFRSRYADLASVVDACREALTSNGLSVVQAPKPSERNEVVVETILLHSSGQWISSDLAIPVNKSDAQGYGSALTYARRYALAAMVGVAPEDDDGNAASKAAPVGLSEEAIADHLAAIEGAGSKEEAATAFKAAMGAAEKARDSISAAAFKAAALKLKSKFEQAA